MMKIKKRILISAVILVSTACTVIPPKRYIENSHLVTGKLDVEIESINNGVRMGGSTYYPDWAKIGRHTVSVFMRITNNSEQGTKTNLKDTVLVVGGTAYHAAMYMQGALFYPKVELDPEKMLEPGETIERILLFKVPSKQVPEAFIWKGVGSLKIPTLAKGD